MPVTWITIVIVAYLVGSVPTSYLAARSRGIDLRKYGTKQVGGGNLWRMTSWKLGLPIGLFDLAKGGLMMWLAQSLGLGAPQQLVVGLAVIVGHNWPLFLRFHGGRGISILLGVVITLPLINSVTPWPSVIAVGIAFGGMILLGSSPLPVFVAAGSLPLTHWAFGSETAIAPAFLAIFLIIVVKRLAAQPEAGTFELGWKKVLLTRLLFDRDIMDRKLWMYRQQHGAAGDEPSP